MQRLAAQRAGDDAVAHHPIGPQGIFPLYVGQFWSTMLVFHPNIVIIKLYVIHFIQWLSINYLYAQILSFLSIELIMR